MLGWGEGRRPKPQSMEERRRRELDWAWRIVGALVTLVIWILVRR